MRICLYTDTALPKIGGQEFVVDGLARQFTALGHEAVVLAPHPRRPLRAADGALPYRVVRHPRFFSRRFFVPLYRHWLLSLHREWPFDVLHCHGLYPPGYLAALCRERLRVPTVLTSHGGDLQAGHARLTRAGLHQRHVLAVEGADKWVAISRHTRDGLLRLCPWPEKLVAIPNGVDLDRFAAPVRRPPGLDLGDGEYVLFLGRLTRRKGVDLLLRALAHVPDDEPVRAVVAGAGEEEAALRGLAEGHGLGARVRFVGRVVGDEKAHLLQNALCVVVPSRGWEGFPVVVLEAYAARTPVIATHIPGLADLVQPGRTGWLVSPEEPQALADALCRAYRRRDELRQIGEQARQRAAEHSWDVIARRHLRLYEELCEGSRSGKEGEADGRSLHGRRPVVAVG
jgi:glycosyltransferase involved in cell wall biosynthesis